jgi:hypothetical protein
VRKCFTWLTPSDDLLQNVRRTGIELHGIIARIAQRLYPDSIIFGKGFEETPLPDNYFDSVIGNIAFGNYPVYDPPYRRQPALTRALHYLLAKSLDKLRAGGRKALVTSHYAMDTQEATIRRCLAEHEDLLGAIPCLTRPFKADAGTEVLIDILFLQRRGPKTRHTQTHGSIWHPSRPGRAVFINA